MNFAKAAFDKIIAENDRREPEEWCVALVEVSSYYGGPEEGGWWGRDTEVISYARYSSQEQAEHVAAEIRDLAQQLTRDAKRADGEYCLRTMEWLEARGLDADFLPEPDGPAEYKVIVTQGIPTPSRGPRHYE